MIVQAHAVATHHRTWKRRQEEGKEEGEARIHTLRLSRHALLQRESISASHGGCATRFCTCNSGGDQRHATPTASSLSCPPPRCRPPLHQLPAPPSSPAHSTAWDAAPAAAPHPRARPHAPLPPPLVLPPRPPHPRSACRPRGASSRIIIISRVIPTALSRPRILRSLCMPLPTLTPPPFASAPCPASPSPPIMDPLCCSTVGRSSAERRAWAMSAEDRERRWRRGGMRAEVEEEEEEEAREKVGG